MGDQLKDIKIKSVKELARMREQARKLAGEADKADLDKKGGKSRK